MSLVANLDSVAFNRSYVAWPRWGFAPTYYCCFDPVGLAEDAASLRNALAQFSMTRAFLNDSAAGLGFTPSERIVFVSVSEGALFRTDGRAASDFGNVGASSLQIVAALGYQRVALTGVDGRYAPIDKPGDARQNYFTDDYVVEGHRMLAFDDATSRRQWDRAAEGCRAAGLDVVNASVNSALECFPRMDLPSALKWLRGDAFNGAGSNE